MEGTKFVIRYRNASKRVCRLILPIELYSPEECEQAAEDIRVEGHTDVSTFLEAN